MTKITISFKTPDAVDYAIKEFVEREFEEKTFDDEYERKYAIQDRENEIKKKLEKWVSWGEAVEIEFDLDKMEAKVV